MAPHLRVTFISFCLSISSVAFATAPTLEPDARLWLTLVTELVHQEEDSNLRPIDAWEEGWQAAVSSGRQKGPLEFLSTAYAADSTNSCMIAGWVGIKVGNRCKSPDSPAFQAVASSCIAPAFVCNPEIFGPGVCADTSTSRWTKSCAEQTLASAGVDKKILTNPKGPDSLSLKDAQKLSAHLTLASVNPDNAKAMIQSLCAAGANTKQDSYDCKAMNRVISSFYKKTPEGCADCVMESADLAPGKGSKTPLADGMKKLQEKITASQEGVLNDALKKMPCDEYVFSLTASQMMNGKTSLAGVQELKKNIKRSSVTQVDTNGQQDDFFSKAVGVCELEKLKVSSDNAKPLSEELLSKYHPAACGVLRPFELKELHKQIDEKCPGYRAEVHRLFFKTSTGATITPSQTVFLQKHADALAEKNPGYFDPVDCVLAGIPTCTEGGPRAAMRSSFTQLGDQALALLAEIVTGRVAVSKLSAALPKLLARWAAPKYTVLNPRMLGTGASVGSVQAVKSSLGAQFMRRLSYIFNPLHNKSQALRSVEFLKDANFAWQAGAKNQAFIALKSSAGAAGKFLAPALLRSYALTSVSAQAYDLLRLNAIADDTGEAAKRLAEAQANLDKISK